MADYVCPYSGRVNAESPDSEERDLMMDCPRCGSPHLHQRYPDALSDITARELAELIDEGLSPPEAVDYLVTTDGKISQNKWAVRRGVTQQAVSENVRHAREQLDE